MALGKRIAARLTELGWKQRDLLDRIPTLSPQALSNLIRRDSVRSEWDELIAEALNMDLFELVYGRKQAPYPPAPEVVPLKARQKTKGPLDDLVDIAETMSERGVLELVGQARLLAAIHPKAKPNHAS